MSQSYQNKVLGECRYAYLGSMDYEKAWALQRRLVQEVAEHARPNTLLLLEHPAVFTLGRRSKPEDILVPRETLVALGAHVVEVDRGGEITFHGPGQLVGYPIVNLRDWGGPLRYVRALEATLINSLAEFGVSAHRIEGLTGVWVGDEKIAAIGVRISGGVTSHGFALNVNTDLRWFQYIVPCGIRGKGVTSMKRALGRRIDLQQVAEVVAACLGRELGMTMAAGHPEGA